MARISDISGAAMVAGHGKPPDFPRLGGRDRPMTTVLTVIKSLCDV
jgi:hypothetical protein